MRRVKNQTHNNMQNKQIKIYTGNQISVLLIQQELKEKGILSNIQNDFQSGLTAGFGGGSPDQIDLLISIEDVKEASEIVKEFVEQETKE